MNGASLDIAHMLAGGMVLVSFMLLYQDRMFALLNVFALHAVVLSRRSPGRPTFKMRPISMFRRQSLLCSKASSYRWRCGRL